VVGVCNKEKEGGPIKTTSYKHVKADSPEFLKRAIAKTVVSVAIEGNKTIFRNYKSGVITSSECGIRLDHGVAAVGYGTENGQDYFLVRNSWGPNWGDNGYVKIGVADGEGICGINHDPSYPSTN